MIRKMLCGLLSAAALSLPVQAARPVAVQVDGEALETAAYVEQGVTYVPLRDLMNALGDWEVWWASGRDLGFHLSKSFPLGFIIHFSASFEDSENMIYEISCF